MIIYIMSWPFIICESLKKICHKMKSDTQEFVSRQTDKPEISIPHPYNFISWCLNYL